MTIRGRGIACAAAKAFPFPFSVPPARAHRPGRSTGADTARTLPLRHPGPQGQGPVRPSRSMPPRTEPGRPLTQDTVCGTGGPQLSPRSGSNAWYCLFPLEYLPFQETVRQGPARALLPGCRLAALQPACCRSGMPSIFRIPGRHGFRQRPSLPVSGSPSPKAFPFPAPKEAP